MTGVIGVLAVWCFVCGVWYSAFGVGVWRLDYHYRCASVCLFLSLFACARACVHVRGLVSKLMLMHRLLHLWL